MCVICEHLQAVTEGRIRNPIINIPGHAACCSPLFFGRSVDRSSGGPLVVQQLSGTLSHARQVKCRRLIESNGIRCK
jgi:hypothetical protein